MDLKRRLHAVERRMGGPGVCPLCKGRGGGPWVVHWLAGFEPRPKPPGCPACGKPPPSVKYLFQAPPPGAPFPVDRAGGAA